MRASCGGASTFLDRGLPSRAGVCEEARGRGRPELRRSQPCARHPHERGRDEEHNCACDVHKEADSSPDLERRASARTTCWRRRRDPGIVDDDETRTRNDRVDGRNGNVATTPRPPDDQLLSAPRVDGSDDLLDRSLDGPLHLKALALREPVTSHGARPGKPSLTLWPDRQRPPPQDVWLRSLLFDSAQPKSPPGSTSNHHRRVAPHGGRQRRLDPAGYGLQPPRSGSPIRRPKRSSSSGTLSILKEWP
jgi:hypothetical protein